MPVSACGPVPASTANYLSRTRNVTPITMVNGKPGVAWTRPETAAGMAQDRATHKMSRITFRLSTSSVLSERGLQA